MRALKTTLWLTLLVFFLFACTSQHPPSPLPSPTHSTDSKQVTTSFFPAETHPPPTATATELATDVTDIRQETSTPEKQPDLLTQYNLSTTLNYNQHHLAVEEQITYPNQSGEPISELLLIVESARYPGVFHLNSITWEDETPVQDYTRELGLIRIALKDALQPGDALVLSLSYDLTLPSPDPSYYGRPVPFGYSTRQTNLVDWYPFIPPYVPGQGWLVHKAGAFGEHLVYEVADFIVNIRFSDSNPNLLIAASAPAVVDGEWYRYDFRTARNFSWSASDQYVLSTTTVDSVVVLSYYFPVNAKAGEAVLQTSAEALGLYNDLFGRYPRQTLTVVEADFLDGMEYDGLYFLSKGFYNLYSGDPGDYLTAISAHETAHQWWYGLLGNDQALEPWLDEALCTYSERMYYEHLHPQGLDWWWTYRVHYYEPRGWVDGSIYNPEGYRSYRDAIYLNGALFMEDLRNLIGEQAFFNFIYAYAQVYAGQIVTADDFFNLLKDYSQADITPLYGKYFQYR